MITTGEKLPQSKKTEEAQPNTRISTAQTIFTEALVIAACPIIAYGVTFAFEKGVAARFGFPGDLVSPTPTTLFQVGGLFLFLFVVAVILSLYTMQFIYDQRRKWYPFAVLAGYALLFIVLYSVFHIPMPWWFYAILGVTGVGMMLVEGSRTYLDIPRPDNPPFTYNFTPSHKTIRELVSRMRVQEIFMLLLVWFGLTGAAQLSGYSWAMTQREFFVATHEGNKLIVLRFYGDRMVCAPFNRKTKEIDRHYVILSLDDKPELIYEEIGPLKMADLKKSAKSTLKAPPAATTPPPTHPTGNTPSRPPLATGQQ